jgi:O-antigen ligase
VNAPAPDLERRASRVVAVSTALFLIVAPVTASPGWRVATLAVAAIALAILAFRSGTKHLAWPLPTGVVIAYCAWAAIAAASLSWSVNADYTMSELRREIFYGALAFAVFFLGATDAAQFRRWAVLLIAGAALLALAELARSMLAPGLRAWDGGPGRFSTHLALVAPFLILLALERPLGLGRHPVLLAGVLAVFFASALLSQNRIVWVAFLASLATAYVALAPAAGTTPRGARTAAILVLAASIVAFFALSLFQKAVESYPAAAGAGESLAMDLRPRIWAIARNVIAERPLLGHGFGREIMEPRYRSDIGHEGYQFGTHGHNVFVNATVSLGFVGLAALVLLLATLAAAHVRLLRQGESRILGALGLALLAAFVAKNLTDDFFNRHNALVFWALNGMLLGLGQRLADTRERPTPLPG